MRDDERGSSPEIAALLDESAVRRVLALYCRAIDRIDTDLLRACYWPEAVDRHGGFTGTRDEFVAWVEPLLRRHTMTMHHLGGIVVDQVQARPDTLVTETYGVAYHAGEPVGDLRWNYSAGFRYVDRFERRAGEWRIADRMTVIEWVSAWDADRERLVKFGDPLARRDRTDPVHLAVGRAAERHPEALA